MRIGQHFGAQGRTAIAAWLAVVALLIQALLPAAAMAAQIRGQTMVICTIDGMKTVALDPQGQPEKGGFAGLPCADCLGATTVAVLDPAISVTPAVYAVRVAAQPVEPLKTRPRARAPPRPFGQGPPAL